MSNWTKFRDKFITAAGSALIEKLFGWAISSDKKDKDEVTEINPQPDPKVNEELVRNHPEYVDRLQRIEHLRFGASTGLLIKPGEHGGIVVLLPGEYGKAESVKLEGPRGSLVLESTGFANPHRGKEREHWRARNVDPSKLNRKLGKLGKVFLVVDGHKVDVPRRFDERNE